MARTGVTLFRGGVFFACALPALWLFAAWQRNTLGIYPEEAAIHFLGRWGLNLLLLTLALGLAYRLSGWVGFMAVRRQLGLWAFVYLATHAWIWMFLDMGGDSALIAEQLAQLHYLQVGLASLVILVPLVLTSVSMARTWLGRVRWQWLHRLAYPAAAGGVVHVWLLTRADFSQALNYALVLALLVIMRVGRAWLNHRRSVR